MAEDLKFSIGFDEVKTDNIDKLWKAKEKEVQDIIDKNNKLHLKIDDMAIGKLNKQLVITEKLLKNIDKYQKTAGVKAPTGLQAENIQAAANRNAKRLLYETRINENKLAISIARRAKAEGKATTYTKAQNKAWSAQKGILNGMPQMMNSYLSILGAARTFANIKNITAEFELQRVSLAAITRDAEFAEQLFNRIKLTAIASPFTTKELVTYTKQLAAYRIENEELFDTMNKLSDVSAGLGVSMDRLVLAFGQVKAASVLRGTELRQFTEAGIPLVDLLAKKFSQLNGEMVTTGDVFELISKRAVPFEMVKEIFDDMTKAGGTFYQMQKKQAEFLYGVWANVPDNIELAFEKLGRDNRGVLIGIGKGVTELFQNFDKVINVIKDGAIAFGVYRVAVFLSTQAIGNETKALLANEVAAKKTTATRLMQEGVTRSLIDSEKQIIATMNTLTYADKKRLVTNGQLTQSMLQRMFVTGKLSKSEFVRFAVLSQMDRAEIRNLANLSRIGRMTKVATLATKAFVVQLKALAVSMLTNPALWIAAIGAIAMHFINARKEAREFKRELNGITTDKIKALNQELERFEILTNRLNLAPEGTKEYLDTITELNNSYGVYLPNLDAAADKNAYLAENIDKVTNAIKNQKLESALIETEGKIDEKYANDLENIKQKIIKFLSDTGELDAVTSEEFAGSLFEGMRKAIDKDGKVLPRDIRAIFDEIIKDLSLTEKYAKANKFGEYWEKVISLALSASDELISKNKDLLSSNKSTFAKFGVNPEAYKSFKEAETSMKEYIKTQSSLIQQNKELSKEEKAYQLRAIQIKAYSDIMTEFGDKLPKSTQYIATALEGLQFQTNGTNGVINAFVENMKNLSQEQRDYYKITPKEGTTAYFERLNTLLESNTKDIEENIATINIANATPLVNPDTITKLGEENTYLTEQNKIIKLILEAFDKLKETKKKGTEEDPLAAQLATLKSAYKEYQDLEKLMSKGDAKKQVKAIYGFEIDDELYRKGLEKIQSSYEKIGDKAKAAKIGNLIFEFDSNQVEKNIKAELDRIKDLMSKQSKAQDFYDKILGFTGDADLASQLTLSISSFEFSGADSIREQLVASLENVITEIDIETPIVIGGKVDTKALSKVLADTTLSPEHRKLLEESFNQLAEYDSKTILSLYSSTEKYKDIEAKKTKILQDNAELRRKAIEQGLSDLLPDIDKKEGMELQALDLEEFKKSVNWSTIFGDLDRVSSMTINSVIPRIEAMKDSLDDDTPIETIKELEDAIRKLKEEAIDRDPFTAIKDGWEKMTDGLKAYRDAKKIYDPLESKLKSDEGLEGDDIIKYNEALAVMKAALDKAKDGVKDLKGGFSALSSMFSSMESGMNSIADFFTDILGENEFSEGLKDFAKGFGIVASVLGVVATAFGIATVAAKIFGVTLNTLMPWMWLLVGIAAAIGAVFAAFGAKSRALEAQQDTLKASIKDLENAYDDLTRAMDKALGEERLEYFRESIKNLEEQKKATQDLINLEKQKKSKDQDAEQLKDWERELELYGQKMEDAMEEMQSYLLTSNLTSASERFAQGWLDAYLSFEDTKGALESSFQDMLKNLIVKSVLAKTMEKALTGVFDAAAGYIEGKVGLDALLNEIDLTMKQIPQIDTMLRSLYERLGINLQQAGQLGGMAIGISQASEDAINAVVGAVNTAVYYLAMIHLKMTQDAGVGVSLNNLIGIQNSALAELKAININTSRSAKASESMFEILESLTKEGGITKLNINI